MAQTYIGFTDEAWAEIEASLLAVQEAMADVARWNRIDDRAARKRAKQRARRYTWLQGHKPRKGYLRGR